MKLVGVGGTDGSGKDTIGNILAEKYGWLFISVTDLLRQEATERGLTLERKVLRAISAEWRRQSGMGVLVDRALEAYKKSGNRYAGLVLASLRHPGEVDRIHELGGMVVWVDADPEVRYMRIMKRKRGTEDEVTFDQFIEEEKAQSSHSGDEATLSLSDVKAKSDITLENNGNDIEAFKTQVEQTLSELLENKQN